MNKLEIKQKKKLRNARKKLRNGCKNPRVALLELLRICAKCLEKREGRRSGEGGGGVNTNLIYGLCSKQKFLTDLCMKQNF